MNIPKHIDERLRALADQSNSIPRFASLIVRDDEIIAEGFAHTTSDYDHGVEEFLAHAEESVILNALKKKVDVADSDIYVLGIRKDGSTRLTDKSYSCMNCSRLIHQLPIRNVVYPIDGGWKKVTNNEMFLSAQDRIE